MNFCLKSIRLLCLPLLLAATAASAQTTTLKIATVVPEGTDWMATMRAGIAEIEERTEGRVKFKVYGGGVQGNHNQVVRKMRIGQLHGGVFTSGELRTFQEDAELYGVPRLFRNFDEARYVRERLDVEIYRRLDEAGYVTFGYATGGFAYLFSNSPVSRQDDLAPMKFWIPEGDKIAQLATRAMGVNPVSLPITDVLTGLQTDLIDTVMGPPVGVIVMQWHTAMSKMTDLPLAYVYAGLLLDKRPWSRISTQDQAIVREVMTRIYRTFDQENIQQDSQALQALLDQGIERVSVPDNALPEWERVFREANEAAGEAGEFDVELYRLAECHVSVFRGESAEGSCTSGQG
jgi:TRAP-type C4-dicarboxylate transport system substrate-binding protein